MTDDPDGTAAPWSSRDKLVVGLIAIILGLCVAMMVQSINSSDLENRVNLLQAQIDGPHTQKPPNPDTIYTIGDLHLGLPLKGSLTYPEVQNKDMIDIDWAFTRLQWRVQQLEQRVASDKGCGK